MRACLPASRDAWHWGTEASGPEQRWRKTAHENGNSSVIPISNRDHVNQIATAIPLETKSRLSYFLVRDNVFLS
jgi:hypothetical protein